MIKLMKDLYQYRELLRTSVQKEIRGKYKGAWLGIIWSFLNPLFMSLIYSIVFGNIFDPKVEHYSIMVVIGVTAWTFFTSGISQGTNSVVANGAIVKKVYFPREILPVAQSLSNLVVFFITSIITFVFVIFNIGFSIQMLWFPVIAFVEFLFILGITFISSAINVYVRDLEHIIGVILMALFYLTPVAFILDLTKLGTSRFGSLVVFIVKANPVKYILDAFRNVLMYNKMPSLTGMLYVLIISVITIIIGLFIFRKLQKGFAEEF